MSVLLINAPYDPGGSLVAQLQAQSASSFTSPNLALGYLAAALVEAGFEVRVSDPGFEATPTTELVATVTREGIRLVGISCVTATYPAAVALAGALRAANPDLVIIVGGHHVTYLDEETLATGAFDVVVRGEGEQTLLELACFFLRQSGELADIPGISFRAPDGATVRNPARPATLDLSALPRPARELFAPEPYAAALHQGISMVASRGCFYRCSYCAAGAFNRRARYRPVDDIIAEVAAIRALGFPMVRFVDDNLFARQSFVDQLLPRLAEQDVIWAANVVATARIDRALLQRCKDAGAIGFFIGVESGSDRILAEVRRPNRIATVLRVAEAVRSLDLTLEAALMVGHPGETEETLAETEGVVDQLRGWGASVYVSVSTPLPGTYLFDNAEALGVRILHRQWELYNGGMGVADTPHFTAAQLTSLRTRMQARASFGDSPLLNLIAGFDINALDQGGPLGELVGTIAGLIGKLPR